MLYFDIRLQHGRPRTGGTHHEEIKHAHRINYIFCIKTAGVSGFAASLFCKVYLIYLHLWQKK